MDYVVEKRVFMPGISKELKWKYILKFQIIVKCIYFFLDCGEEKKKRKKKKRENKKKRRIVEG